MDIEASINVCIKDNPVKMTGQPQTVRQAPDEQTDITVTVIIATFNRENYLRQSLESVISQTHPPDQIIVVNDGSTDMTGAILAEYQPQVEVLEQVNSGKPASLNRALRVARGSHVWIFDDDDLALPHALASNVDFLKKNPGVDFCYSRNYLFRGDEGIEQSQQWRRGTTHFIETRPLLLALLYDCELIFQTMLVPMRCFSELGYFNEKLARAEDYDMLIKLARHYRGGCNDTETIVWRDHYGDRGPAHERHADSDRTLWDRHYERQIFTGVWLDLTLNEYLVSGDSVNEPGTLSAAQTFDARLQRCEIMFRHDLVEYGGQDLAIIAKAVVPGCPRFVSMCNVIRRAADVGDPVFVLTVTNRARHLGRAVSVSTAKLRLSGVVLKGFYWAIERARRKRRVADTGRIFVAAGVFLTTLLRNSIKSVLKR